MTDEERIKEYERLCDEAHSNLEAPLLGSVGFPICKSCLCADYTDGWSPKCAVYGDMPTVYMNADKYDCPEYKQIPNIDDCFLPRHMRKIKK